MEPTFRLRFLGAVQIEQWGEPVRGFDSRKALALLGYLALQNRPVPREQLADLFWSDKPESRGRANLSWVLSKISKLLPGCVEADRHTIQFQRTPQYWLDIDAFETLESQRTPASLSAAAALYRGEFLEGMSLDGCAEFELWAVGERERWRQRVMQALDNLITQHSECGEYDESLRFARRMLALEPWREKTHRQVMRLMVRSGRRANALAQYESCRQVLAQELGVDPLAETTALYERIQRAPLAREHNFPAQPTRFVGREHSLEEIARLLANPECRLLTVLGPGGVGKTRLALQAATDQTQAYLEGVFFIPLAPLSTAEHLTSAIAETVGFSFTGQDAPKHQLLSYLRGKEMLLILDNFEHLLEGAESVAEILREAPEITALVTSREPLNLRWEWRFEIEGLRYPIDEIPDLRDLTGYSAIQLFEQIAQRASPRFQISTHNRSAVTHICRLVEGLPLGIELAAAWVGTQTCTQIANEIKGNLDFLQTSMRDVPERHKSLRATFEHSWRLLSPREQQALASLSVFRGGFQPEAAGEVIDGSANVLQSLVDKSLLRFLPSSRCEMHELLRHYAAEKLSARPEMENGTRDQHCTHYTTLLQEQERYLDGERVSEALAAVKPEIANAHSAWRWAVENAKLEDIARGLDGLSGYYALVGPFQQGEMLIGKAVDRVRALADREAEPERRTRALLSRLLVEQARFFNRQGKHRQASAAAQTAVHQAQTCQAAGPEAAGHLQWGRSLWRQGDYVAAQSELEIAAGMAQRAELHLVQAKSLRDVGTVFAQQGDFATAMGYYEESLHISREIGNRQEEGRALNSLGLAAHWLDDYAKAMDHFKQALHISREIGDRWREGAVLANLGHLLDRQGDWTGARRHLERALRILRDIGDRMAEGVVLGNLGNLSSLQGDFARARVYYEQALHIHRDTGESRNVGIALLNLGLLANHQGDFARAKAYYEQALHIHRDTGDRTGECTTLSNLGLLAHRQGEYETGREFSKQALDMARELGNRRLLGFAQTHLGHALTGLGQLPEAADAYQEALDIRREIGLRNLAIESLAGLARVALAQGDLVHAQEQSEEIMAHLDTADLDGVIEPLWVYWTCYRVLKAGDDPRAQESLNEGYRLLQQQASKISDEEMRHSFLENIAVHREIVATFESQSDQPAQAPEKP